MQFLQPTQSEAYAKKTRFPHKLSGSEQLNPFGHSLRGAVATRTKAKQAGLNHVTVLDYFIAVSLALSQHQPYSSTATIV